MQVSHVARGLSNLAESDVFKAHAVTSRGNKAVRHLNQPNLFARLCCLALVIVRDISVVRFDRGISKGTGTFSGTVKG